MQVRGACVDLRVPSLDPGIAWFLDEIRRRLGPVLPGAGAVERRRRMEATARAFAVPRPAGLDVDDHHIPLPGREIPVRVYRPPGKGAKPALVFLHGGGWVLGSLDTHDGLAAALAHATGCVVIAVHYRRAPENPFPAPLDDCVAAFRWAHDEAGWLGIDTGRIGLCGDSAGAHLAIGCALRALVGEAAPPAALGLFYPTVAPNFERQSYREFAAGPLLTRDDMIFFWTAFLSGDLATRDPLAVPALSTDLARLPPTFVVTAEIDPLRDEGEAFAAQLAVAAVPVTLRRGAGLTHGFFRALPFSEAVLAELSSFASFVHAHLGPAATRDA